MTTEATPTASLTIDDLTTTTALHLIASHLGGDPQHGDAAAGYYVDGVNLVGDRLTVAIGDEDGHTATLHLSNGRPLATGEARATQPTYLDPYPFAEPAPRS